MLDVTKRCVSVESAFTRRKEQRDGESARTAHCWKMSSHDFEASPETTCVVLPTVVRDVSEKLTITNCGKQVAIVVCSRVCGK